MRTRLSRRLFLAVALLLLGALGWHTYRQVRQARLNNELVAAVNAGDLARASVLLDAGADPNARPLTAPAPGWRGLVDCVLGRTRPGGPPVVAAAAARSDWPVTIELLRHGAHPNVRDAHNVTPLVHACGSGALGAVRLLLRRGADPNARDADNWAALHAAAAAHCYEAVPELLQHGADPRTRSYAGTPLEVLADRGYQDLGAARAAEWLLRYGADPDSRGGAPLYCAIARENTPLARVLLRGGANPNTRHRLYQSPWSTTPLHIAVDPMTLDEMVPLLLHYGADPTQADGLGRTPVDLMRALRPRRGGLYWPVLQNLRGAEADWRRKHAPAGAQGTR